MSQPSISVIVPTFNRAGYIEQCLDSLLVQTVSALEILVIDDGSEDDTAVRVARYGNAVTYTRKANGGKPSSVNLGLSRAQGDLIWIFDDDDVALPTANESRLEALAAKPGAGFVFAPHVVGTDGPDGRIVPGKQHNPPQPTDEFFFFEIMRNCFFHLGTALVRRELHQSLGGLDPTLFSGEDYDFQIRLARIARPAFCAAPAFVFRQHRGARGAQSVRYSAAERGKVFRKYSQVVGQKLYSTLSLGEYLTPPVHREPEGSGRRQALLNRVEVMANHGCMIELVKDLHTLLALENANQRPLSAHEARSIAQAMRTGWAYDACAHEWPQFAEMAAGLKQHPGGKATLRAMATGFFGLAKGYPDSWARRWAKALHAARLAAKSLP